LGAPLLVRNFPYIIKIPAKVFSFSARSLNNRPDMAMISKLTGLVAAPFTPMNADGSVNLGVIEQQARVLADNKVIGAFICGTTGEGMSLTVARFGENRGACRPPEC
jgi:hypothetical protein